MPARRDRRGRSGCAGDGKPLNRVPSFTLGTDEVTPLAMAGAYATFANHGTLCHSIAIARVTDRTARSSPCPRAECTQVLDREVADTVTCMLTGVIDGPHRRSHRARDVAGPARRGQDGYDERLGAVWFVGFTPDLAAAVAVGDPRGGYGYPMKNLVISGAYYSQVFGSTLPGPIWKEAMEAALRDPPETKFDLISPTASASTARRRRSPATPSPTRPSPGVSGSPAPAPEPHDEADGSGDPEPGPAVRLLPRPSRRSASGSRQRPRCSARERRSLVALISLCLSAAPSSSLVPRSSRRGRLRFAALAAPSQRRMTRALGRRRPAGFGDPGSFVAGAALRPRGRSASAYCPATRLDARGTTGAGRGKASFTRACSNTPAMLEIRGPDAGISLIRGCSRIQG